MKRLNVVQRFALLSLLCIGVLSVALGLTISSLLTRAISEWEWENTAAFVRGHAREHDLDPLFTDPGVAENRRRWRERVGHMLHTHPVPGVVRVRAWDREGTVLSSDDERIVGKKFPDNRELQDALAGKVAVRIGELEKAEAAYEREQFPRVVAIYVPIFSRQGSEVVGVLEVYKSPVHLFANIRRGRITVWVISLAGGLLLYLTLLPVMRHTYRTELEVQRSLAEHASRLEDTVAARTRELAALNAATATVSQSLDPREVLEFIVASTARLLQISVARLWVFDGTTGQLATVATAGDPDLIAHPRSSFRPGEGLAGRAFETREVIAIADPAQDPRYVERAWAREKGIAAVAAIPLLRGEKVLGVLSASRRIPRPFSEEELKLLTSFAASAAIALDNARLHERTKADAQFQRSAREITLALTSALDLDQVLLLVCREMVHLFQVDGAYLWTLDEAAQELVGVTAAGHKADLFRGMRASLQSEGSLSAKVVKERKGCFINRVEESELAGAHLATLFDSRSVMALPLIAKEKFVGVIVLNDINRLDRFDERLLKQAELVAPQVAIAIENVRLFEAEERTAREARSLYEVAHSLTTSLEPTEVLRLISVKTVELLGTPHAQVVLWDEATQTLRLGAAHGTEVAEVARQEFRLGEGANGIVAQTRAPLIVNDYQNFPHRVPEFTELVAVIGVPLLYRDRLLGVLTSHATQRGWAFTQDHLALLTSFANQAAVALENARLHEKVRAEQARLAEWSARLASVYEVTKSLIGELSLDALLQRTVEEITRLIGAKYGDIGILAEGGDLERFIHTGLSPEEAERIGDLPKGRGLLGVMLREGRALRLEDLTRDPRASGFPPHHPLMRSFLGVPIVVKGKVLGHLYLTEKADGRPFTQEDEDLASNFAAAAAVAIDNARLYGDALEKTERLQSLIRTSAKVAGTLQMEGVLRDIAEEAAKLLGVEGAGFRLLEGDRLVLGGTYGLAEHVMLSPSIRVGASLGGRVVQEGRPIAVPDLREERFYLPEQMASALAHGVVAYLGVPLRYRDRIIGALNMYGKERRTFREEEVRLVSAFADHAAIAIENARLYEEIQRHAADLEERVRERTAALEEVNRRLAEAVRVKSEFLATMSHEFQTPLNSIIGFSEMLQDQAAGLPDEKHRRYLANIHQSGQRLSRLLRDILELSRLEREPGSLELEEVALPDLLEDLRPIVAPSAASKSIALDFRFEPRLPSITADPVQVKKVLYHLLSNAIKFTPSGGAVRVAARRLRDSQWTVPGEPAPVGEPSGVSHDGHGDCVEISVQDTGIGIKPEDLPKLFQPFTHLEPALSKQHAGAGLGLSLAKRLVEMHGGRIRAESEGEGRGSTFTVILPVAGPGEPPAAPAGGPPS